MTIIIGAGEVGFNLDQRISHEKKDVVVYSSGLFLPV